MSLARGRAASAVVAVAAGFITGLLAARAGGSLGRAPLGLAVIAVGLGGCGLCIGALLGFGNDKAGTVAGLAIALAAYYYTGLWVASPLHSVAGDVLTMIVSTVPACMAAAAGFAIGGELPGARPR